MPVGKTPKIIFFCIIVYKSSPLDDDRRTEMWRSS